MLINKTPPSRGVLLGDVVSTREHVGNHEYENDDKWHIKPLHAN